ncbi:MAG TPA: hypothetical protein VFN68_00765 [Acidimicrobiales bacterium]|nr:hypothetical protein [Acidimicrobiales bacterium]
MHSGLEAAGFALGAVAVVMTMLSAIRAVVLPRAVQNFIPRVTTNAVRFVLRLRAARSDSYHDRDRVMAMVAPMALISMLATWLAVLFLAYALMMFCITGRSVAGSFELSGSSIVTLGTASDPQFWPSMLSYSEAALGLLLVALFITYFPSIYSAFTRRETGVTLLQVRAGDPPQATTMLIRYHRIEERRYQLTELWRQWEAWFSDIEESHTTFPILAFFRSPQPERSWITAAGALLDGAAFWVACVDEHPIDPDAQLCIRAGFLALRRIADAFDLPYDPDPAPDGPVTVSRYEWEAAMTDMAAAGVPLVADREQAWAAWRGWRVNYDTVLLRLARLVEAPPAPWVSDRSPVASRDARRRRDRPAGSGPDPGRTASGWRRWTRR